MVFFIILVANIGGALTPLGDPPLFVGFLRGVDFFWTAQHLWLQTAILGRHRARPSSSSSTSGSTARTGGRRRRMPPLPPDIRVHGAINLLLIAAIIAAILLSATWKPGIAFDVYGTTVQLQNLVARRRADR